MKQQRTQRWGNFSSNSRKYPRTEEQSSVLKEFQSWKEVSQGSQATSRLPLDTSLWHFRVSEYFSTVEARSQWKPEASGNHQNAWERMFFQLRIFFFTYLNYWLKCESRLKTFLTIWSFICFLPKSSLRNLLGNVLHQKEGKNKIWAGLGHRTGVTLQRKKWSEIWG